MERVVIINNECFRDSDIPLAELLSQSYIVEYYLVLNKDSKLTRSGIAELIGNNPNFHLHIRNGKFRRRNLGYFFMILGVYMDIIRMKPKKVFTGFKEDVFAVFLLLLLFNTKRIVYMLHDAERHPCSRRSVTEIIGDKLDKILSDKINSFLFFSAEQEAIFRQSHQDKKCTNTPKPLTNFGVPTIGKPNIEEECRFLFFGSISEYKGIETLLQAFHKVSSNVAKRISLSIYGKESYTGWKRLLDKSDNNIHHHVRFVDDNEIPNIFNSHHFLVLPYKQVTQSGPMSIALSYGVPIIASNIGIFANLIENGKNGFLFEKEKYTELAEIIEKCSCMTSSEYERMILEVKTLKERIYDKASSLRRLTGIVEE